ncbi:MAG: hypothetical protein RIC16_11985 [Rhodospirillales bacterium]
MKKILIGAGVVVVIVIGAVAFLAGNLDSIIKKAVEEVGTKATGASVTLADVELSLTDGSGALRGLRVGNPAGFDNDYAFDLGGISIKIDPDTVTSDPVVIKEVIVDGPKLIYELARGSSNIDAIQKNVDAFAGGSGGSSGGGEGPKLVIEDLYIRGGDVRVAADFLTGGQQVGTSLPDIHLEDIGKDSGGASAAEIADKVISSLTSNMSSAVSKLDIEGLMENASDAAKAAADEATKAAEGAAGEATKAIEGATEGIGSSINNLLGTNN